MKDAIRLAGANGNLTGLRMARNDLIAMLQAVPGRERRGLDLMLRERAGFSLDDLLAKQLARIRRIAERGNIKNDTEYYMVREHIEMIWENPDSFKERDHLIELMNSYGETIARRGRQGDDASPAV